MKFDYSNLNATSIRLITRFGQSYTLERRLQGAYNPATGELGAATESTQTVQAVRLESKATIGKSQAFEQLFEIGMQFYLVAGSGLTFEPQAGDLLEVDGIWWEVMATDPIKPGDVSLAHTLMVREGGRQ